MRHFLIWLLFLLFVQFSALAVRAGRLEAVWIGPDGDGGEGDWNTPSHWNLGVVPHNGTDADRDGVPDIFDVRIDRLPAVVSLVRTNTPRVEIAGLRVDEGDTLNLVEPLGLTLRDTDEASEVTNNGLIGLDGVGHVPALTFAGESITLSGGGTLHLGAQRALPGIFAALDGGRIINGRGHTIKTSGIIRSGRLTGFHPETSSRAPALTNHGTVLAEDRSELRIDLNDEAHFNHGTIQAESGARLYLSSNVAGGFRNHGLISTSGSFGQLNLEGLHFVNESDGVLRASSGGRLRIAPPPDDTPYRNLGLIEADGGVVEIEGGPILNEGHGAIQALYKGVIRLIGGTYRPDPAIRLLAHDSTLAYSNVFFENEGNVLAPPGPGLLSFGGHILGGEVTNGDGRLFLSAVLEDVSLHGTAIGAGIGVKGTLTFNAPFSVQPASTSMGRTTLRAHSEDATLAGPGVSKFGSTWIFPSQFPLYNAPGHQSEFGELTVYGELVNNGVILADTIEVPAGVSPPPAPGVLSGSGVIVSPLLWINPSGTLSPGDGIGTMPVFGRVWFRESSTLLVELGTTDSDLLDVTGNIEIGIFGDANLALSGGLVGESYLIAKYTGERVGTFGNVTPGYNVIYDELAKQIRVEPIPEPASIALALMGLAAFAVCLRSRTAQRKGI